MELKAMQERQGALSYRAEKTCLRAPVSMI